MQLKTVHPIVGNHDLLYPQENDVGLLDFNNKLWFYYLIDDGFTRITTLLTAILMGYVTFFTWIAVFEFLKFWFFTANL